MFTGIVEERGSVESLDLQGDSAVLRVSAERVVEDATHGASIAVNGVCLTVVDFDPTGFSVDVMRETLSRSSLGDLAVGSTVNLERAMPANGRFGGHIVQGHVDGTGSVLARHDAERWTTLEFSLPPQLARYLVEKGSITVDGVSLTVASVSDAGGGPTFTVSLIPSTLAATTLGTRAVGDRVNLEVDVLAKYLERLAQRSDDPAAEMEVAR